MKALAINSSPRMDQGATAMILTPFLQGLTEEGVEVEILYTSKLDIKPCMADYNCWMKTPGICIYDDDMNTTVLPKVKSADILVLSTPLYVDGMSGPMKMLIDRFIPLGEPFITMKDDHCRHDPLEKDWVGLKTVLVSSCGFWELDNFDALVTHVQAICKNLSSDFAGALIRPHAPAIRPMVEMGVDIGDIFEAAKDAGSQLAREGTISGETLSTVSRPLVPLEDYVEQINTYFNEIIEKHKQEAAG